MKIVDPESAAALKLVSAAPGAGDPLISPDSPLTAWRKNMIR